MGTKKKHKTFSYKIRAMEFFPTPATVLGDGCPGTVPVIFHSAVLRDGQSPALLPAAGSLFSPKLPVGCNSCSLARSTVSPELRVKGHHWAMRCFQDRGTTGGLAKRRSSSQGSPSDACPLDGTIGASWELMRNPCTQPPPPDPCIRNL